MCENNIHVLFCDRILIEKGVLPKREKSIKCSKLREVLPLFADWVLFLVVVRKECGCFGESKLLSLDINCRL